ncbi:MAG TPA: permease [Candidatus Limnocylindria bacterium]|nr:permease [Candidatus Limnocylindria bacterium]
MKNIVRRYRVFLLLALANAVIGIIVPAVGLKSLQLTRANLLEMLAVVPPIFILLGLMDVWVDRATMMRYTGKGSGVRGALIAFLLGSAAAGPLYAAFPVAGVMLKKGSSLMNVFIFIGAWSTTKIPMLTFEAASLGLPFTLTRLMLSIGGIIAIALVTQAALDEGQREEVYGRNSGE